MKATSSGLRLSASDLANHLGCQHLTFLELSVTQGELEAPSPTDVALEMLQKRGVEHEREYVEHLRGQGLSVLELRDLGSAESEFEATCEAMREGPDVIVQATLLEDGWLGRADVLRSVDTPSPGLGQYSYEVLDTKLSRQTRGRTILQLCLYSDVLGRVQGLRPESTYVVPPGRAFEPEIYRVADFMAYYRLVRRRLVQAVSEGMWQGGSTYPVPCEQCSICRWWRLCDEHRRADDHLSLVAGISRTQVAELEESSIATLEELATAPHPLEPRAGRGSVESYRRIHHQARVQLVGRDRGEPVYEVLPLDEGRGLFRLPRPAPGDLFLDVEGARYVGEVGLEYLFGFAYLNDAEERQYEALWAFSPAEERAGFEHFMDEAMARWEADEGFHIYHYAPYEPATLKRLMGRYATREDELDRLLRGGRFVDLYTVVRQAVRASVESYSLKELEPFFGYRRKVDLREASRHLRALEIALEFAAPETIPRETRTIVQGYNEDDCLSTLCLREWLEGLRAGLLSSGHSILRPEHRSGEPSEELDESLFRTRKVVQLLTAGLPPEPEERSANEQAQWILAHLLEWHRREDKGMWWEYFRLAELDDQELLEEPLAIGGLLHRSCVDRVGRGSVIDRYSFPAQETRLRAGDKLLSRETNTAQFATIVKLDPVGCTVDLRKGPTCADVHPQAVFAHEIVPSKTLREALLRIGQWVAGKGIDAPGACRAGRDLLLGKRPRLATAPVELVAAQAPGPLEAARRLVLDLDGGVLPIQGPPGSGKTFTGARMICEAVAAGAQVGITAGSHKVIRNLLEEVAGAAAQQGLNLRCVQKVRHLSEGTPTQAITETTDNARVFSMLNGREAQVAAGTAWLWAREEAEGAVDVLFVDEAGQLSLANALALSQAARSLVLLGDPQQLEQPQRGSHPQGTDVSALEHLLGEHQTLPPERGLFLGTTWRLHPELCAFTSELFYEGRLHSRGGLEQQVVLGETAYTGAGLWYVPVEHVGNRNESVEEAAAVSELVAGLACGGVEWVDKQGATHPLTLDDVLIVSPYNAQVSTLLERLPRGARVGTVDKFQGQEAPIVIYSTASSSPEDAPRGMEFLYSLSRLNVATSRARCACILVASPRVFEPECHTPRQMRLANAFCRYLELARTPC